MYPRRCHMGVATVAGKSVRASGRQGGGLTLRWASPEGFKGCMRGENLPMTLTSAKPVLPHTIWAGQDGVRKDDGAWSQRRAVL